MKSSDVDIHMIGSDLEQAVAFLKAGQLVGIPTETVYGLAGNALNEIAVAEIFAVKKRPNFDPLIVHLAKREQISDYVLDFPAAAQKLALHFMPGPLTLLLPKQSIIPDLVTAGSDLVAIRIPAHPMALALLEKLPFPLAAPSANPFGYISPTSAQHVVQQLGHSIPYVLDGGPCEVGVESTIIGFEGGQATIYRKGGLPIEAIEALVGPLQVREHSSSNPQAPGMLKSHYAPHTPFLLGDLEVLIAAHAQSKIGVISFQRSFASIPVEHQIALSPSGNFSEAARHLFAAMRKLDTMSLDIILAELFPEKDLGRAINDRLRRAAARA
jgi:L-threonylcarbamoyladenylate synthase